MSKSILIKVLGGLLFCLPLSGCSNPFGGKSFEDDPWFLGFCAPAYMNVYIETADVLDINGHLTRRAGSGIASVQEWPNLQADPKGWISCNGGGKGRDVRGADLPREIYVRWQSLVEPQTYYAYIPIPESARQIMLKGEQVHCKGTGRNFTDYRDYVGIGLAPGGIIKVWLTGQCSKPIEIGRLQGKVIEEGPDRGKNEGRYAYPLTPASRAYIEKFGIPYGSW